MGKYNKQNKTNKEKLSNKQKRKFGIIGFTCLIILLLFILVLILSFNTVNKSDAKKIMKKFDEYYNSSTEKVVLYYDSKMENQIENDLEIMYMKQLSSDYNIEYLKIDAALLSKKNRKEIEDKLGINEVFPSIAVLKNNKVVAINEGFIESHKLTSLLIDTKVLPKDAKYKYISNLTFISYKDYKKIIKEKDVNIIVIGQSGCQYCNSVKPILNNISRAYDKDIYYLDVDDISKEDLKELFEKLPSYGYDDESLTKDNSFSMPTVLLFKKSKILKYIQGQKELEEYIKVFEDNKAIE